MRTLIMIRHAKSSWDYPHLQDFERPIIESGIKRTEKLIKFLKKEDLTIDLIVSSHATRALETAHLIANGMHYPTESIYIKPDIYIANEESLRQIVYALPDDVENILMVGHNPTFTQFVNNFLKPKIDYLPTSGAVSITFKTPSWAMIDTCEREINFVVFPKKIDI